MDGLVIHVAITEIIMEILANPVVKGVIGATVILIFLSLNVLFLTWVERKLIARVQVRYGPNRAGKFGLLQPIADGAKLITKEDIIPKKADRPVFILAPAVGFLFALLPAISIPLAGGLIVSDLNIGILYIVAVASLSTIAIIMAGWGSNNKYTLLGGMRAVGQSLSYEMPLVLSIIGVVIFVGSLSMTEIVSAQKNVWFVFLQPVGFLVFLVAAIAEMGRIPFDLPESESELVAGFHTEYSGMRFALLLFAEYIHMVVAVALMVALFFGGWYLPVVSTFVSSMSGIVPVLIEAGIFITKMYIIIFILMWIRATLPRIKIPQMIGIGWKVLIPIALANILVTSFILVY